MNYQFTEDNGDIKEFDYSELPNKINRSNIVDTIKELYAVNGKIVNVTLITGVSDVYKIEFGSNLNPEYIIAKETTPGGRNGLQDEQRIQINGAAFHYLFERGNDGFNTAVLGLYKYFDKLVVTAWQSIDSSSSNPVSKRIKINCISEGLLHGFCQQKLRNQDVYYCAFIPEFYNFYMKYKMDIHSNNLEAILSNGQIASPCLSLEYNKYFRQLIYFGAPGTGKSKKIETELGSLLSGYEDNYERVTFHPDYSYAHFVGTYKPVPKEDDDSVITYEYVPGPFLRTFVKAVQSNKNGTPEPYLLIIEEINRANVAAVFGDVFQLLDRKDNVSEYSIQTSEDMRKYLAKELGGDSSEYDTIQIPSNMFIWATMNSADQGVFPMDTAFKRRWKFEYISVDANQDVIKDFDFMVGKDSYSRCVNWNQLRKAINYFLLDTCHVNEDKLLGPFFIKPDDFQGDKFIDELKNKVLMYLFDDAAKHKRNEIFNGADKPKLFSSVVSEFEEKGIYIFHEKIHNEPLVIRNSVTTQVDDSNINTTSDIDGEQ